MVTPTKLHEKTYIEKALTLLLLLLLLYLLHAVLGVFLGVFTYAIILTVSLSTPFEKMVSKLGHKRSLAAFIYAVLAIVLIALPFIYMVNALGQYVHQGQAFIDKVKTDGVPPLPEWVNRLPAGQDKIKAFWTSFSNDPKGTLSLYDEQIRNFSSKLIGGGLGIAGAGFEIIIGIIVSAILLVKGIKAIEPILVLARRVIGEINGPALVYSAGKAIKGVSVGVIGTASLAGLVAWIGFSLEGLSIAPVLAAIIFFLVIIQIGPLLVVLPMAIWQFSTGDSKLGIFTVVFGIVLLVIDNVVKPILIGKSGKLPVMVLFLGVIGGMAAWGFTGMFKGAIIMAVFYTLMQSWTEGKNPTVNNPAEDLPVTILDVS